MMWNIGDKVKWSSQAQGSEKEKCGTVHAVVPVGSYGRRYCRKASHNRKRNLILTTQNIPGTSLLFP